MSSGIHHVTAVAGDPQRNVDFYAGFLGLKLVKKTVNFDDPGTYHLYYGDGLGRPGTIMTFFPFAGARRGQRGVGGVAATAFSVPQTSLGFWLERLSARNLRFSKEERFGDPVLTFDDPDGLRLELVAYEDADAFPPWEGGPVTAEHAVRGFYGVTLWEENLEETAGLLTRRFGFRKLGQEGNLHRYAAHAGPGGVVDIQVAENFWPGVPGAGTVHHVAFRVGDDAAELALREGLLEDGLAPTPVIDRQYFHVRSTSASPAASFSRSPPTRPALPRTKRWTNSASALKLPPQYEGMRERLEATLPPLYLPGDRPNL